MAGKPADSPSMAFVRVRLVTAVIGASMFVLLPVTFLSALFLHNKGLGAVGIVILAVGTANNAVLEAFRIKLVLRLGRWTGWKQEPIWRNEQPIRYWSLAAMHTGILAVYSAAAVFLVWGDLNWIARR